MRTLPYRVELMSAIVVPLLATVEIVLVAWLVGYSMWNPLPDEGSYLHALRAHAPGLAQHPDRELLDRGFRACAEEEDPNPSASVHEPQVIELYASEYLCAD